MRGSPVVPTITACSGVPAAKSAVRRSSFGDGDIAMLLIAIAVNFLAVCSVHVNSERGELGDACVRHVVMCDVEMLQAAYGRARHQRVDTGIAERSERDIESLDPIEDRRRRHGRGKIVGPFAVAQRQGHQLRKSLAVEDTGEVLWPAVSAIAVRAEPDLEMLQFRQLCRADLVHNGPRQPAALNLERLQLGMLDGPEL